MAMKNHETVSVPKVYTSWQTAILVVLRVFIGWHFLYEGLVKLLNPYWSAAGYLVLNFQGHRCQSPPFISRGFCKCLGIDSYWTWPHAGCMHPDGYPGRYGTSGIVLPQ